MYGIDEEFSPSGDAFERVPALDQFLKKLSLSTERRDHAHSAFVTPSNEQLDQRCH